MYLIRNHPSSATYRLSEDMPEKLREALPDVEELKQLLWKSDIK